MALAPALATGPHSSCGIPIIAFAGFCENKLIVSVFRLLTWLVGMELGKDAHYHWLHVSKGPNTLLLRSHIASLSLCSVGWSNPKVHPHSRGGARLCLFMGNVEVKVLVILVSSEPSALGLKIDNFSNYVFTLSFLCACLCPNLLLMRMSFISNLGPP